MQKYRGYRVRCPVCGLLAHSGRFYGRYRMEVFIQKGRGRGKGFEFMPVPIDEGFAMEFRPHFLEVMSDLVVLGVLPASFLQSVHRDLSFAPVFMTHPVRDVRSDPAAAEFISNPQYEGGGG
mgnify:CR=1 FL=1